MLSGKSDFCEPRASRNDATATHDGAEKRIEYKQEVFVKSKMKVGERKVRGGHG